MPSPNLCNPPPLNPPPLIPPPPPPDPLEALCQILRLCDTKWVCDFLFNPDPAHLTILTAPLLTRHALTCTVEETRAPTIPAPTTAADHLRTDFVFVPAFSVAHVTAGFGMQQNALTPATPPLPGLQPPPRDHFRYVRDDLAGALLLHYHAHASRPNAVLHYIANQSTTTRHRLLVNLNGPPLRTLLHEHRGTLSPHTLLPHVTLLQSITEHRPCPLCHRPPLSPCACALPLRPPRHSLDFRGGIPHLASHAGPFAGHGHIIIPTPVASLTTHMRLTPAHMPDLVRRLTRWAVSQHLNDFLPPLPSAVHPPWPLPRSTAPRGAEVLTGEHLDFLSLDATPTLPPDDLPDPVAASALQSNFAAALLGTHLEPVAGGATIDAHKAVMQHLDAVFAPHHPVAALPLQSDSILGKEEALQEEHDFTLPPVLADGEFGLRSWDLDMSDALPVLDVPAPEVSAGSTSSGLADSEGVTRMEASNADMRFYEKPVMESAVVYQPQQGHNEDDEDPSRLRELKLQLKKERNRASAKRSNQKKKLENDARKRERDRLNDLEIRLRVEEQRLRTENLQLRKKLYGTSGTARG